jgi:4-cresol dehydrogenase (hydroxylating)
LCGSEGESPESRLNNGKVSISHAGRRALQQKHGLDAWTLSRAFYGPSVVAIEPQITRVLRKTPASSKAYRGRAAMPPVSRITNMA